MLVTRYNPAYHMFKKDGKYQPCFYLLCTEKEVRNFFYNKMKESDQEQFEQGASGVEDAYNWLCGYDGKDLYHIIVSADLTECILAWWGWLGTAMNNCKQDFLPFKNENLEEDIMETSRYKNIVISSPQELLNIDVSDLREGLVYGFGETMTQEDYDKKYMAQNNYRSVK